VAQSGALRLVCAHTHTHTHTHSLTHSLTHSHTHSLTHTRARMHTYKHRCVCTLSPAPWLSVCVLGAPRECVPRVREVLFPAPPAGALRAMRTPACLSLSHCCCGCGRAACADALLAHPARQQCCRQLAPPPTHPLPPPAPRRRRLRRHRRRGGRARRVTRPVAQLRGGLLPARRAAGPGADGVLQRAPQVGMCVCVFVCVCAWVRVCVCTCKSC